MSTSTLEPSSKANNTVTSAAPEPKPSIMPYVYGGAAALVLIIIVARSKRPQYY